MSVAAAPSRQLRGRAACRRYAVFAAICACAVAPSPPSIIWYAMPFGLCKQSGPGLGTCPIATSSTKSHAPLAMASYGTDVWAVGSYPSCDSDTCGPGVAEGNVWWSPNAGANWTFTGMWPSLAREEAAIVAHALPAAGAASNPADVLICVLGGRLLPSTRDAPSPTASVLCTSRTATEWSSQAASLPVAVHAAAAVSHRGAIYVAGGTTQVEPAGRDDVAPRLLQSVQATSALPSALNAYRQGAVGAVDALAAAVIGAWTRLDAIVPWRAAIASPLLSTSAVFAAKLFPNGTCGPYAMVMHGGWGLTTPTRSSLINTAMVACGDPSVALSWRNVTLDIPGLLEQPTSPTWSGVHIMADLAGNSTAAAFAWFPDVININGQSHTGNVLMLGPEVRFSGQLLPQYARLMSVNAAASAPRSDPTTPFGFQAAPRAITMARDEDDYAVVILGRQRLWRGFFRTCEPCEDGKYTIRTCPLTPVQSQCVSCKRCGAGQFVSQPCDIAPLLQNTVCETCSFCPARLTSVGGCDGVNDTICAPPMPPSTIMSADRAQLVMDVWACFAAALVAVASLLLICSRTICGTHHRWSHLVGAPKMPRVDDMHAFTSVVQGPALSAASTPVVSVNTSSQVPECTAPDAVEPSRATRIHATRTASSSISTRAAPLQDAFVMATILVGLLTMLSMTACVVTLSTSLPAANVSLQKISRISLCGLVTCVSLNVIVVVALASRAACTQRTFDAAAIALHAKKYPVSFTCILCVALFHTRALLLTVYGFGGFDRLRFPWSQSNQAILRVIITLLSLATDLFALVIGVASFNSPADTAEAFDRLLYSQTCCAVAGVLMTCAPLIVPTAYMKWVREL